jgi:hypothetical protein
MTGQPLILDIWRLIFEHVKRETLYDVCLTWKSFNAIATPILYRTISLIAREPNRIGHLPWHKRVEEPAKNSPLRRHWYLLSRLEEEGNDTLRNYVQKLDLSTLLGPGQLDQRFLKHLLEDGRLPRLIGRLPNLRRVTIGVEDLQTKEVVCAIACHTRNPELSLETYINEENTFYHEDHDQPLPCITDLQISLNPFDQHNAENHCIPAAQRLIFNSANLRSLSLTLWWRYGGCVVSLPQYPVTTSFQFTGNEVFPPIEELSLDGYGNRMRDDEWAHWRDRFDWSKLRSLTLGPQDASGVLDRFAGYATALTSLEVRAYVGERSENRTGLEALLCAFGSLRTLKLEGYICSVEAVAQHKGLEELWLHEDESASAAKERRVLTADDLEYLDKECPRLKTLKVDIKRGDDELVSSVYTTQLPYLVHIDKDQAHRRPFKTRNRFQKLEIPLTALRARPPRYKTPNNPNNKLHLCPQHRAILLQRTETIRAKHRYIHPSPLDRKFPPALATMGAALRLLREAIHHNLRDPPPSGRGERRRRGACAALGEGGVGIPRLKTGYEPQYLWGGPV